ncbi:hypothetical protein FRN28_10390 [Vibrio vulnificus]|nr:hypothetical protein [Vibrio vulnificus]
MPLSISYSPLETRDQDHSQVGVKMSKCLNNEGQLTLFRSHETVSWRHSWRLFIAKHHHWRSSFRRID